MTVQTEQIHSRFTEPVEAHTSTASLYSFSVFFLSLSRGNNLQKFDVYNNQFSTTAVLQTAAAKVRQGRWNAGSAKSQKQ